jgi:uncharacterized RDD family membrane protein YckC
MTSYPRLFLRIQAMLWDSVILGIFFVLMITLSDKIGINNELLQGAFFMVPTLSLEPLLVYFTGSSIGHRIAGIKISHISPDKNISLLQCYTRFFVKLILGAYSLLALAFTKKHQALHDIFTKSIVVFIDENKAPTNHKLTERSINYRNEKPSWLRRVVVMLIYIILLFIGTSIISAVLIPYNCIEFNVCTADEVLLLDYIVYSLLIAAMLVIILGCMCKLPGIFYKSEDKAV